MKIRWQVSGGTFDYMEFTCDCGRVARVGVGDNNWEEPVDGNGRPVEGSEASKRRPRVGPPNCYRSKYDSNDAICRGCPWRTSCATHISIGVPHTNAELERIRSEIKRS